MEVKEVTLNEEKIYLRKSILGWKVVYPIKIDNKINWKNFIAGGSWFNLVIIFLIVIVIIGLIFEYLDNIKLASACLRALPDYVDLSIYVKNPSLTYLNG